MPAIRSADFLGHGSPWDLRDDRPHRPPIVVEDLDGAVAALREGGLRVSAVRRLVLEALLAADGPIPAEQIAASGSGGLDLASVYRNLETFEELGLVRHVHLGHGPGLYALSTEGEREYLVCGRCRRVTALPGTKRKERTLESPESQAFIESWFSTKRPPAPEARCAARGARGPLRLRARDRRRGDPLPHRLPRRTDHPWSAPHGC